MSALGAELGARLEGFATAWALGSLPAHLRPAVGAELGVGGHRCTAAGAVGALSRPAGWAELGPCRYHGLALDAVTIDFSFPDNATVAIEARVHVEAKTGVEMEALTAVSVAALTIYDMCKAADRRMVIDQIQLEEK